MVTSEVSNFLSTAQGENENAGMKNMAGSKLCSISRNIAAGQIREFDLGMKVGKEKESERGGMEGSGVCHGIMDSHGDSCHALLCSCFCM